jgi:signal transduction histidine kinase
VLPDYRVRQRDYLLEIARSMTQELDLDKLLERILRLSASIVSGQAGIVILRGDTGEWHVAAAYGINPDFIKYFDPLLSQVPKHEDPARFELPEINRLLRDLTHSVGLGLLSGVWLPLNVQRRVVGVIFLFRTQPIQFNPNDRLLLQSFADQAAVAVTNARLFRQSQRERQRMQAILDVAVDGMLILAPDHTIEHSNPAFASLVARPQEEIQGRHHDEVLSFTRILHGTALSQAALGGWPLSPTATLYTEGDIDRPGDSPIPVGVTYSPLMSADGTVLNLIAIIRDITRFREADELKATFISVVSHELKTPVALIKGYTSTLRREDAVWEKDMIKDSLEIIEEESDRLAAMIDNLLDASRLEAGGLRLNFSDVSLAAQVTRQVERFNAQAGEVEIRTDFPENFPYVLADEDRIGQVISNLISNALKYGPEAGVIRIAGQVRPDEVILCVQDEGPGITPGDVPHVFDRFYRSDSAVKTTKGAGLGLYLSRAVVEAHGGRIWVEGHMGSGAQVCFSLPRER